MFDYVKLSCWFSESECYCYISLSKSCWETCAFKTRWDFVLCQILTVDFLFFISSFSFFGRRRLEIVISFPFKQILHLKGDPAPFIQINELVSLFNEMYHFTVILGSGFTRSYKKILSSCILSYEMIVVCLIIKSILWQDSLKLLRIFVVAVFWKKKLYMFN